MSDGTMFKIDAGGNLKTSEEVKRKKKSKKDGWDAVNFGVGFYLLTPILLGLGVGLVLDRVLNTRPLFTLLFLVLGVISSFYNLWKLANKN